MRTIVVVKDFMVYDDVVDSLSSEHLIQNPGYIFVCKWNGNISVERNPRYLIPRGSIIEIQPYLGMIYVTPKLILPVPQKYYNSYPQLDLSDYIHLGMPVMLKDKRVVPLSKVKDKKTVLGIYVTKDLILRPDERTKNVNLLTFGKTRNVYYTLKPKETSYIEKFRLEINISSFVCFNRELEIRPGVSGWFKQVNFRDIT